MNCRNYFIALVGVFFFVASVVRADVVVAPGGDFNQTLENLEAYTRLLQYQEDSIPDYLRPEVAARAERLSRELAAIADRLNQAPSVARWFATDGQDCTSFCRGLGKETAVSPEGARCVSGENVAASAVGTVVFKYGCYPSNCPPVFQNYATSYGRFCYAPGQKKDSDRSDITVGCFCR